jgi:hypothetical protein
MRPMINDDRKRDADNKRPGKLPESRTCRNLLVICDLDNKEAGMARGSIMQSHTCTASGVILASLLLYRLKGLVFGLGKLA